MLRGLTWTRSLVDDLEVEGVEAAAPAARWSLEGFTAGEPFSQLALQAEWERSVIHVLPSLKSIVLLAYTIR